MFNTNEWLQWARQNQENNPIGKDFRSTYWKNGAKSSLSMSLTESIQQVINEAKIDKNNPSFFPEMDADARRDAATAEAQTKVKAEQEELDRQRKAEQDAKDAEAEADAEKKDAEGPTTVTTATGTYEVDDKPKKKLTRKQKLGAGLKGGVGSIATGAAWQVGGELADRVTSSTGLDKFIKRKEDQGRGVNLSGASNTNESVAMGAAQVVRTVLGSRLGKMVKGSTKYIAQGAAYQKGAEIVTPKPKPPEESVTTSQQQEIQSGVEYHGTNLGEGVGMGTLAVLTGVATIVPAVIKAFSGDDTSDTPPPTSQDTTSGAKTPNRKISRNLSRLQSSKPKKLPKIR